MGKPDSKPRGIHSIPTQGSQPNPFPEYAREGRRKGEGRGYGTQLQSIVAGAIAVSF